MGPCIVKEMPGKWDLVIDDGSQQGVVFKVAEDGSDVQVMHVVSDVLGGSCTSMTAMRGTLLATHF